MTLGRIVISIGGAMQLVGVALVFVQIRDVQELLRGRSWTKDASEMALRPFVAIRNRLRPGKNKIVQVGAAALSISTARADIRVTVRDPVQGTLAERLDAHRRQLEEHDRQLESLRADLQEQRTAVAGRIDAVQASVNAQATELRRLIDVLGVGSLRLQAVGGGFILAGTALTIIGTWL